MYTPQTYNEPPAQPESLVDVQKEIIRETRKSVARHRRNQGKLFQLMGEYDCQERSQLETVIGKQRKLALYAYAQETVTLTTLPGFVPDDLLEFLA